MSFDKVAYSQLTYDIVNKQASDYIFNITMLKIEIDNRIKLIKGYKTELLFSGDHDINTNIELVVESLKLLHIDLTKFIGTVSVFNKLDTKSIPKDDVNSVINRFASFVVFYNENQEYYKLSLKILDELGGLVTNGNKPPACAQM
jgi:hypothetical protein